MTMPYPYAGTAGYRSRENDEGYGEAVSRAPAARTMTAKFKGRCINTGAVINVGDTISFTKGVGAVLVSRGSEPPADGRYISNVFRTSGGTFYRNKRGVCEDAPCCGCCTI